MPPCGELLSDDADLSSQLAILLLQFGDQLIAVNDAFEFIMGGCCMLQDLLDSGAVFALQFGDEVKSFLNLGEAARIVFDIGFVATDTGGNVFQAVDSL